MSCLTDSMGISFNFPTDFKGRITLLRYDDPGSPVPAGCSFTRVATDTLTNTSISISLNKPSDDSTCGNEVLNVTDYAVGTNYIDNSPNIRIQSLYSVDIFKMYLL